VLQPSRPQIFGRASVYLYINSRVPISIFSLSVLKFDPTCAVKSGVCHTRINNVMY
jgi:hypothetical protein